MFLAQNLHSFFLKGHTFWTCFLVLVCLIVNPLVLQPTLVLNCRLMVILFLILLYIVASLALFNMPLLLVRKSPILFSKPVSLCMILVLLIWFMSDAFSAI